MDWTEVPAPNTMKEVLDAYDKHHDALTKQFHAMDEASWQTRVPFMYQGQEA